MEEAESREIKCPAKDTMATPFQRWFHEEKQVSDDMIKKKKERGGGNGKLEKAHDTGNREGDWKLKGRSGVAAGCIKTRKRKREREREREKRHGVYRHWFRSPGETAKFPSMLLTINATRPYRECYLATCQPSYREQRLIFSLNVALTGLSDVTPETLRRRRAQIICVQKRETEIHASAKSAPSTCRRGSILCTNDTSYR